MGSVKMMLYFCIFFAIFLFALYDISIERNRFTGILISKQIFFLFVSLIILLGGIRWITGTDWYPYYYFFINNKTWNDYNDGTFEVLYAFLNYFVKLFTSSYTIFLLLFTFFTVSLKYKIIKNIALYPALSFFLYFAFHIADMFAVRQTLAISILFLSIPLIHEKKKSLFILIVLIASCIHITSLIWLISYYFYHKRFKKATVIFISIVCLFIGLLGGNLFLPIINFISSKFGKTGRILLKLWAYSHNDDAHKGMSLFLGIRSVLKTFIFIPFFLYFREKLGSTNKYMAGLVNLYVFSNIFYLLFAFDPILVDFKRLLGAYMYLEMLLWPAVLRIIKEIWFKYLFLIIILLYGLIKFNTQINSPNYSINPFIHYYSIITDNKSINSW